MDPCVKAFTLCPSQSAITLQVSEPATMQTRKDLVLLLPAVCLATLPYWSVGDVAKPKQVVARTFVKYLLIVRGQSSINLPSAEISRV